MQDPINILIVDDEPKNLTVLETVLDDPAYRLVRAESADQAPPTSGSRQISDRSAWSECQLAFTGAL